MNLYKEAREIALEAWEKSGHNYSGVFHYKVKLCHSHEISTCPDKAKAFCETVDVSGLYIYLAEEEWENLSESEQACITASKYLSRAVDEWLEEIEGYAESREEYKKRKEEYNKNAWWNTGGFCQVDGPAVEFPKY